jgi:hypothetical protein
MQSASRRGLAQVGLAVRSGSHSEGHRLPPGTEGFGFLLQAGGRLLRTKAVNDASFASIAGLDKVGSMVEHVGGRGRRRGRGDAGFALGQLVALRRQTLPPPPPPRALCLNKWSPSFLLPDCRLP